MTREEKRISLYVLGLLFCANMAVWIVVFGISKAYTLEVCFLDVGQGDAILIETPEHHQILIDGGPGSGNGFL